MLGDMEKGRVSKVKPIFYVYTHVLQPNMVTAERRKLDQGWRGPNVWVLKSAGQERK